MSDESGITLTPAKALITIRAIWATLLVGELVMAAVLGSLAHTGRGVSEPGLASILLYASAAMVVALTLVGYFARNQAYKAGWRGDAITPAAYVQGNVVLLGLVEAAATVSLVGVFLGGALHPYVWPAVAAAAVQLVNFPTGKPMEPTAPVFPDTRRP